jgi:hypothetical protein
MDEPTFRERLAELRAVLRRLVSKAGRALSAGKATKTV